MSKKIENYIRTYGKLYTPAEMPEDIELGVTGDCFDHCAKVATGRKYRYVEGLAMDPTLKNGWMLHSWLTDESGKLAYDPTWFVMVEGKRINKVPTIYLGIEMDIKTLAEFMSKTEYKSVIANGWRNKEIASKLLPNFFQDEKDVKVEVFEEYSKGRLIRRIANGIDMLIPYDSRENH